MIQKLIIDIHDLSDAYYPVIKSYSAEFSNKIIALDKFKSLLFNDIDTKTTEDLFFFADRSVDKFISSVIYRFVVYWKLYTVEKMIKILIQRRFGN